MDNLERRATIAEQLRRSKNKELPTFFTHEVLKIEKFLRFDEIPSDLADLLKKSKIFFAIMRDKSPGPNQNTFQLYVKDSASILWLLKQMSQNWSKAGNRYDRRQQLQSTNADFFREHVAIDFDAEESQRQ